MSENIAILNSGDTSPVSSVNSLRIFKLRLKYFYYLLVSSQSQRRLFAKKGPCNKHLTRQLHTIIYQITYSNQLVTDTQYKKRIRFRVGNLIPTQSKCVKIELFWIGRSQAESLLKQSLCQVSCLYLCREALAAATVISVRPDSVNFITGSLN